MTISLDRAAANLRNNHEVVNQSRGEESSCLNPPPLEPSSSTKVVPPLCCGSPSRSSTSHSRTRSRTPSPPQSSHTSRQSSLRNSSSKAPRSVSPGGTAASSAPDVTRRGVRFAKRLVSAVYTRPRTPIDQRAKLFYSRSDEIRFREEAAYACDDDWLDQLEEDSLPDENAYSSPEHQQQQQRTYSISKAVVVFGSTTRTYGGGCAFEAARESEKAFSFDDDAFWSGQLTWS
mmetsp:Transcript_25877/g.40604  ORF Transcript_25877/g.40604 Transcript_25877/m.40604 type:complete len:232 (+) Transcript_25877:103-798(+)